MDSSPKSIPQLQEPRLNFIAGLWGAVFPFLVFVCGVVYLALSGAPDERGFWPVLVLALGLGLFLARDRRAYCEVAIEGMSQHILMIMILAWMLASIIGVVMRETEFIQALTWLAGRFELSTTAFVLATFLICCVVSTSTGTSFGTILICGPILYPAGGLLGAHLPTLAGAILAGATFGDNISPISDTTIASALSQKADLGGVVKSRLKYSLPAAAIALVALAVSNSFGTSGQVQQPVPLEGGPAGLPMVIGPVVVIAMLLAGRHLLEGLMTGLFVSVGLGLVLGLLPAGRLLTLDTENFAARSLIIDGIERSIGISVFTIFLLGLVATLQASGVLRRLVDFSTRHAHSVQAAEVWIAGVVGGAVLLTTHGAVAILTAAEFAAETGERLGIHRYRRANLLDVTASTLPFILPYFIPVILMASTTAAGRDLGVAALDPLTVGLRNYYSWALLGVLIFSLLTGYGSRFASDAEAEA